MSKYKKGLVNDIKAEKEVAVKQRELREKYHIDENVIVKEKTNMLKFSVRLMIAAAKLSVQIILLILAMIGVLALLYPSVRTPLFEILRQILTEVVRYIPWV